MFKSVERPAAINYIAVAPRPRQERRNEEDWESLYRAQAAEAKIMRVVFVIMAALVAFSEAATVIVANIAR